VGEVLTRGPAAALVAVLLGGGCINTAEPTGFIYRYQVRTVSCGTSCSAPGDSQITSAARGDTVWVEHIVNLIAAIDSFTPQTATLRPDCAENVAVLNGNTTVRSLPTPSCADSTYRMSFQLAGIDYPQTMVVHTRWIVDSALAPAQYGLRGRVLVRPRLEPTTGLDVQ
jgi:hypothetical protein